MTCGPIGWRPLNYTVQSQLSDLNGIEGWSDNQKCQIIQKTNETGKGKYQLKFIIQFMILNYEDNTIQHQISQRKIVFNIM